MEDATTGFTGDYIVSGNTVWNNLPTSVSTVENTRTTNVNDLIIHRQGHPDFKVIEEIENIKKQLLIITPDFELMEKYQSLKAAYDHYQVVKALITESETDNEPK